MSATVIEALHRFLPAHLRQHFPAMTDAQKRAVWAINNCRTAQLGGHLHVCAPCKNREFHYHSCNHRNCPQCGKNNTAQWVNNQLNKRIGAPYFMVTFTLPAELRKLFFTPQAKEIYQLFFSAASSSLNDSLANPRRLGTKENGFTMILHTWNQRLHFHPHIHTIVPGAGITADGRVVSVKNAKFLVSQSALRRIFRARFRDGLAALAKEHQSREVQRSREAQPLYATRTEIDPAVWQKDWGINIKPFGSGENIIKYLGRYVCRTAIGDSRIINVTDTHVSFRWKDRDNNNEQKTETLEGGEFLKRYLRHVLPKGLRAIRYYGYCHPAAKLKRERVTFHTGRPLFIGTIPAAAKKPPHSYTCPCCGQPMVKLLTILPPWRKQQTPSTILPTRAPPPNKKQQSA